VPQLVRSMLREPRWPDFTNRALYEGVQSILAFPLRSSEEVFGALNLYSQQEDAFDDRSVSLGETLAARASVVLLNASRFEEATRLADQLQEALKSRAVIDQAKGVLMEREKISADEAFDRLKSLSQRSNLKVRDLATHLVEDAIGKVQ
jgi:GAF domain-containing protein